jgi:hypothetical protein
MVRILDLPFRNVNAAMNRRLNNRENPKRAATDIQYQRSLVNKPLSLRRVFPIVD